VPLNARSGAHFFHFSELAEDEDIFWVEMNNLEEKKKKETKKRKAEKIEDSNHPEAKRTWEAVRPILRPTQYIYTPGEQRPEDGKSILPEAPPPTATARFVNAFKKIDMQSKIIDLTTNGSSSILSPRAEEWVSAGLHGTKPINQIVPEIIQWTMDASIEFFKKTLMKQVNELKEAEKVTKEKLIVQRRQLFTQLEWIQNWLTFLSGEGFITQNVELFYSSELADVVMPKAQPPIENIMEVFLPSSGTSSSSSVMMSIEEAEKIADHCEEILCLKQIDKDELSLQCGENVAEILKKL